MTLRLLVSTSLLLWSAACATTPSSPPPAAAPESASPAADLSADRSLSLEKYVELGVPSPERGWSSEDYARALQALGAIAQKQPAELPRYQSERSGALFSRMTAFENVDFVRAHEIAPAMQVQMLSTLMVPAANILALYVNANTKDGSFSTEMIELQSFVFHASAGMVMAIGQFNPADAADPKAFESGLAQVRAGMDRVMDGALSTLAERRVYSIGDRLRFLGRLKGDLPAMLPWLQKLTRKEVPVRLESLIADERSPAMKEALISLRPVVAAP